MKSHRRKTLAPVAIVCALFITGLFVGEDKDKKTTDAKENIEQAAPAKSEKKAPAKSKKAKAVETVSEVPEEVITEVVEEPEITETEEVQAVSEEDSTPTMPDAAPVTTVDEDTTLD